METRRASNRSVGTGARWFPFPYCFKCRLFRFIESPLGDPVGIYSLRSRLSACLSASNPLLQQHVLNVRHLRTICPAPTTLWKRCLGELLTSTNPTWHEIVPTDPSLPEVDAADEPGPTRPRRPSLLGLKTIKEKLCYLMGSILQSFSVAPWPPPSSLITPFHKSNCI